MQKLIQLKDISDEEILNCIHLYQADHSAGTPEKQLANIYPEKLVLKKMEQLSSRGIINYGVSLHTAWIVDY